MLIDLFSRLVVGWSLSERMPEMAIGRRQPTAGFIAHTDRGSQSTATEYLARLLELGARPSNSGKGNCYDRFLSDPGAEPRTPGLWTLPGLTRPVDGYGSKKPLPQPPTARLGISDEAGDSHSPLENADEAGVFHERPQALPLPVFSKSQGANDRGHFKYTSANADEGSGADAPLPPLTTRRPHRGRSNSLRANRPRGPSC